MLLSLKVPVAMNCCVEPTDTVGVVGVTVIDTNPVGVRVLGRYNSALARTVPVLSLPPATSTCPLFSNVAVCPTRAVVMLPSQVKVPVAGSYSSAVADDISKVVHSHPQQALVHYSVMSRCGRAGSWSCCL